ncbi:hypothetical protein [Clostridium oceanicum]|uniref:Initiator Rep protein domain-containing protein n=1 Tax=Clostridium oceanicum TaxID=1543 RepID=A0ABP3UQV5_9CLOT
MKNYNNIQFQIETNRNFLKKELVLISYLVKQYKAQKSSCLKLSVKNFHKMIELKNTSLNDYLDNICDKKINLKIIKEKEIKLISCFKVFSYYIHNEIIYFFLDNILNSSFNQENLLNEIKLFRIFEFKEKYTYKFYNYIFNNIESNNDKFTLSVKKFRELTNSSKSYKRFYDLEKNLIKPIVKDFEIVNNMVIFYDKNKLGKNIDSLTFHLNEESESVKQINKLFAIVKNKINNFIEFRNRIVKLTNTFTYEEIYEKLVIIKNNYTSSKGSFEDYILKSLNEENLNSVKKADMILKKEFKTMSQAYKFIFKKLQDLGFILDVDGSFFSAEFLKEMYKHYEHKLLSFENSKVKINLEFHTNSISTIEIYLK